MPPGAPWRGRRPRTLLAAAVVAVLVASCGGSSTPLPRPASASPQATVSGAASPGGAAGPPGATGATAAPSATGAAGAPSAGGSAGDWPVYHRDPARSGDDPAFAAGSGALHVAWSTRLDGAVYAEPLAIGATIVVATENDSVYGLDASGAIRWRSHLGTPVPLSTLPCGNIDPLGITGTPAYDPVTGSLFLVAEVTGPRHVLFALDPATGAVRWSRGIDLPGDDPATHQQRPALAVANGYVYVGLGGLDGDCGQYRGEVIGVPTSGHGATIAYRVPTARMGAVWATGGPAVAAGGNLYVSVGNGASTTTYDGTDSVLELSPRLTLLSRFAPATWAQDNATDADLGSLAPALVGSAYVFIDGKSGTAYTLRRGTLGGIGGQVSAIPLCRAFGAAAVAANVVFVPCTDALRAVRVGADGSMRVLWRTPAGANGPPVVGGGSVWSLDLAAGVLYRLDPATGSARGEVAVGPVAHFASPALWDGLVLVGTMRGIAAVSAG